MKAWCIWCQTGSLPNPLSEKEMVWIHTKCFEQLMDVRDKIENVTEYMKGTLPKLAENGNKIGYDSAEQFLVAMDDFNRRWKNTMKLIKGQLAGKETVSE